MKQTTKVSLLCLVCIAGCSQPDRTGTAQQAKADPTPEPARPSKVPNRPPAPLQQVPLAAQPEPAEPHLTPPVNTQPQPEPVVQRPPDKQPTRPQPQPTEPPPADEDEPRKPRWILVRDPIKPGLDATCEAEWLSGKKFAIKTRNVQRLTIDMRRLPPGPPRKGPWLLKIDDQTIEIRGLKKTPGHTPLKRDLIQNEIGRWTVDKEKFYRHGE